MYFIFLKYVASCQKDWSYFGKLYVYNLVVFIQLTHIKSFVKSCSNLIGKIIRNCLIKNVELLPQHVLELLVGKLVDKYTFHPIYLRRMKHAET